MSGANRHDRPTMSSSNSERSEGKVETMLPVFCAHHRMMNRRSRPTSQGRRSLDAESHATSSVWSDHTHWNQQPRHRARTGLPGSTRPAAKAEEQERRWEETERSGGGAQDSSYNPVGPRWLSKTEPRGRLGATMGEGSESANGGTSKRA